MDSASRSRPARAGVWGADNVEQWSDAVTRGAIHILDGGQLKESQPSTVVDCTGPRPRVIRPGAISYDTLRQSVPDVVGDN